MLQDLSARRTGQCDDYDEHDDRGNYNMTVATVEQTAPAVVEADETDDYHILPLFHRSKRESTVRRGSRTSTHHLQAAARNRPRITVSADLRF